MWQKNAWTHLIQCHYHHNKLVDWLNWHMDGKSFLFSEEIHCEGLKFLQCYLGKLSLDFNVTVWLLSSRWKWIEWIGKFEFSVWKNVFEFAIEFFFTKFHGTICKCGRHIFSLWRIGRMMSIIKVKQQSTKLIKLFRGAFIYFITFYELKL